MNLPLFAILVFVGGLLLFGCLEPQPPINSTLNNTHPIIGNDSDIHGCKASAGYSWCEVSQKCIRPWEENCTIVSNITNFDDCVAAGYSILESNPAQCRTPDGHVFFQVINQSGPEYVMNQTICESGGGHWVNCSTTCDNAGTRCSEYKCIPYCECGGLPGLTCPENFFCTDYYPEWTSDAVGICRPNSELIDEGKN